MQAIQIDIENNIYNEIKQQGIDIQERVKEFIYGLVDDGYPAISSHQAQSRVRNAAEQYKDGTMQTISHDEAWNQIESFTKNATKDNI
jgi:hypothetical protein